MDIYLPKAAQDGSPVGQGFEVGVSRSWSDPQTGECVTWDERVLVVCSDKLARRQQQDLAERLSRAERALAKIKPEPDADLAGLTAQSQAILERHRVGDYLR